MRLLHISDVHLGSDAAPHQHLAEFASFVRQADRLAPDVVLITGDFFENNRVQASLVDAAMRLLERLPRVVLLPGNHDALDDSSVYRRYDFARLAPGVRVIRDAAGETVHFADCPAVFWGRALAGHSPNFLPLAGAPPKATRGWSIALAHGHYLDSEPPTLHGSPIYAADLDAVRWDYVALGHWPCFTRVRANPPACYAGELVQDRGRSLGCVAVTLSARGASVERLTLPVAAGGAETA